MPLEDARGGGPWLRVTPLPELAKAIKHLAHYDNCDGNILPNIYEDANGRGTGPIKRGGKGDRNRCGFGGGGWGTYLGDPHYR